MTDFTNAGARPEPFHASAGRAGSAGTRLREEAIGEAVGQGPRWSGWDWGLTEPGMTDPGRHVEPRVPEHLAGVGHHARSLVTTHRTATQRMRRDDAPAEMPLRAVTEIAAERGGQFPVGGANAAEVPRSDPVDLPVAGQPIALQPQVAVRDVAAHPGEGQDPGEAGRPNVSAISAERFDSRDRPNACASMRSAIRWTRCSMAGVSVTWSIHPTNSG